MSKIDMQKLNRTTKLAIIADENCPFEEAIKLVNESDEEMLLLSLKRQDATPVYLHKYVYHENSNIRQAVASNKNIFLFDLEKLTEDMCDEVVIAALSNYKMSEKMISKIINETEYLSLQIILALLTAKKMNKTLYDQLYSKHGTSFKCLDLTMDIMKNKNICEDVFEYFITDYIKDNKIEDTSKILLHTIWFHKNFEIVIQKILLNIENIDVFFDNNDLICELSKNNLQILWNKYLKLEKDLDNAKKQKFYKMFVANKQYISYNIIKHIVDTFEEYSCSFGDIIIDILKNNNIQSDSIELIWRKLKSLKKAKDISKDLKNALIANANTPKKLVSYLKFKNN